MNTTGSHKESMFGNTRVCTCAPPHTHRHTHTHTHTHTNKGKEKVSLSKGQKVSTHSKVAEVYPMNYNLHVTARLRNNKHILYYLC